MIVSELIEHLQKMPQDVNICIFDWRKNLFEGGGDPVPDGIQKVKDIELLPYDNEDEDNEEITSKWVSLNYENEDYNEESGLPDENSKIYYHTEEKSTKKIKKVIRKAIKDISTVDGIGLDVIVNNLKSVL